MPRLGQCDKVLTDIAFDTRQAHPCAIQMCMRMRADLVPTRTELDQRRRIEHLAHHRAPLSHE